MATSSVSATPLTVIMSVYNGAPHLAEAVESILGQSFGDFQFLVMNDGSTDASQDILESYAKHDQRLRPLYRENKGFVASLNELIAMVRTPLIARMDGDDISLPSRFAKQIDYMAEHPECGVLGTQMFDIDEKAELIRAPVSAYPITAEGTVHNICHGGPIVSHPTALMRTHLVHQVGGYHAAFRHCEDFDLWARLSNITKIWSLPDHLFKYRHWSHQVSTRFVYQQHIGAAISRLAYHERAAGRQDPTVEWQALPALSELDALFNRQGVTDSLRSEAYASLRYSESVLQGEGFDMIIDHLQAGGKLPGAWRTVLRLIKLGEYNRAKQMAATLMTKTY